MDILSSQEAIIQSEYTSKSIIRYKEPLRDPLDPKWIKILTILGAINMLIVFASATQMNELGLGMNTTSDYFTQ